MQDVCQKQNHTLFDLITPDGMTLLHVCTQKNSQKCFNQVLITIKEKHKDIYLKRMKAWVRQSTFKDCFSALHYASYRGNIEMIEILIEIGADVYCKNKFGLGVLHVAAQGD